MSEIKLELRYPESRPEDITDAFMRGYESGHKDGSIHYELDHCPACKNIADLQEALEENAKLREYAAKAWSLFVRHGAVHACDLSEVDAVRDGLRELGVEVEQ